MKQVTFEDALEIIRNNITQAYTYACYNKSTKQNVGVLEEQTHRMVELLEEHITPPTWDDVVNKFMSCVIREEHTGTIVDIMITEYNNGILIQSKETEEPLICMYTVGNVYIYGLHVDFDLIRAINLATEYIDWSNKDGN